MVGPDRKRGILTTDDRDYLRGRKNMKRASERNARQRIRDRTRNGLYDFEPLTNELADKDVSQLATQNGTVDKNILNAAEYAIAFIFNLCQSAPDTESYTTEDRFREVLVKGIKKGLSNEQTVLDFKLDLQYGQPREAQKRILSNLRHGKPLTLPELREALKNNYLDDTYQFKPLDSDGFPKNVDPKDTLSHDDFK